MIALIIVSCAADEPEGPTLDAPTANISTISTIFPIDYTKTVIFRYMAQTVARTDGAGSEFTSITFVPVYIPTLVWFRQAATAIAGASPQASATYPPPTKALITKVFLPYILIGVPLILVYLGGGWCAWRAALRQEYLKQEQIAAERQAQRDERRSRRASARPGGSQSGSLASEPLLDWPDGRPASLEGPEPQNQPGYTRV